MLVENERGDRLLEIIRCAEADLSTFEPLPLALLVVRHAGKTLVVFNRDKQHWELPGGMIEAGESARACAIRETLEESGVSCPSELLSFAGVMKFLLQPSRFNPAERLEYGALFHCDIESTASAFIPNEETSQVCWWDGTQSIGAITAIDEWLARSPESRRNSDRMSSER
ncbi:MAG: NUDIX hydrolase [Deltaproteobacteria bacterium]